MLNEMLKPVRNIIIILVVVFLFFMFNFNNKYYSNVFKVTLNDNDLYLHYYEQYNRGIIPFLLGTSNGINDTSNEIEKVVNEIPYNKKMILSIKEYSVYWKKDNVRVFNNKRWVFQKNYNYKEEVINDIKMTIKRKNEVLYNGNYIEDISEYLHEPGRYYFNINVIRKDNFYTAVKTYINFNVIVGGGNNEV